MARASWTTRATCGCREHRRRAHQRGEIARRLHLGVPTGKTHVTAIFGKLDVTNRVAHWGTLEDLRDVLAAGVDELQHLEARGVLDGWPGDVIETLTIRGIPLAPTLAVTEVAVPDEAHQQLRDRVAELHGAGVRIVVGSDAAVPGVGFGGGVHRELELLVAAGLTPREALRSATAEAADVLRTETTGVIEPGRAADLVAVPGDPLEDISRIREIALVLRDGRLAVDSLRSQR